MHHRLQRDQRGAFVQRRVNEQVDLLVERVKLAVVQRSHERDMPIETAHRDLAPKPALFLARADQQPAPARAQRFPRRVERRQQHMQALVTLEPPDTQQHRVALVQLETCTQLGPGRRVDGAETLLDVDRRRNHHHPVRIDPEVARQVALCVRVGRYGPVGGTIARRVERAERHIGQALEPRWRAILLHAVRVGKKRNMLQARVVAPKQAKTPRAQPLRVHDIHRARQDPRARKLRFT